MKNLKENIVQSIYWNYLSSLIIHGISMLAAIILTAILSPSDFGVLAVLLLILGFGSIFIGQGYTSAIVKEKNINDDMLSTIFWINTGFGILVVILSYFLGPLLESYFEIVHLKTYLLIFSTAYFMQAINVVHLALLERKLNFKWYSIIHIWAVIISTIFALAFAMNGFGVYTLIWRSIITSLVVTGLVWFSSEWKPSFVFSRKSLTPINKFSRDIFGTRIIRYFISQLDNLFIAKILGANDLGIYNRAKTFTITPIREIQSKTSTVAYSALSKVSDSHLYNTILFKFVLLLNMVVIPLLLIVVISSDTLIYKYLSSEWYPLADIIKVIGLGSIIISSGIPAQLMMSKNNSSLLFKSEMFNNFIKVAIIGFAFIYTDLYTIVCLYIVSHIITSMISNYLAYRALDQANIMIWKFHILPIIMACASYGLALIINQWFDDISWFGLALKVLICLGLFGIFFWMIYPEIIISMKDVILPNINPLKDNDETK